jgi:hypothetical protein
MGATKIEEQNVKFFCELLDDRANFETTRCVQ